jgi:hypothetical protein
MSHDNEVAASALEVHLQLLLLSRCSISFPSRVKELSKSVGLERMASGVHLGAYLLLHFIQFLLRGVMRKRHMESKSVAPEQMI